MKPINRLTAFAGLALLLPAVIHAAPAAKPIQELQQLRQVLPPCPAFDKWLDEFGYLPPDFDALPAVPYPEDPLAATRDGETHQITASEWPARRKQLAQLVEEYLLGHAPPAPGNVRAVIEEKKQEDGHETWTVRLEFGPDHAAKLHCWLWLPPNFQPKPTPVFLVDNLNYTRFARDAFDQGKFLICVYNATDPVYRPDKKDESENYKDLFGKYDWSEFRRRGWSASRAVDWLSTLDFVDRNRIYIGGHSRSAKQSLACAAFDDRIAGVVASSPGSGGSLHFRYCDQYYYGESAERLTTVFPLWVLPKVRFFAGRENKLPADMHFVYALIAPRPVLMSTAINDTVESTWIVEQMYESIAPVWELLGHSGNLVLRYRPGQHHPDDATCSAHSQFLVLCSEGKAPGETFPFRPYHSWNYEAWARQNPVPPPPLPRAGNPAETRRLVNWLLGDGLAYQSIKTTLGQGEPDDVAKVLNRSDAAHLRCKFGNLYGNFYYPPNHRPSQPSQTVAAEDKLPTIIWLAPLHCATGYTPGYRTGDIPHRRFARAGFLVFAFDPIATGSRQEERRDFYTRYPKWSLMGKMVLDARHAIDAALANPDVDPKRFSLVGFGMGGMVATFTAALDERAASAASASGFAPFRSDTDASGTGGLHRWSHLYGWLPRLGGFVGHETDVPVDFPEILSAIAPRPFLAVAPKLDWHSPQNRVTQAIEAARAAYGPAAAARLQLYSPPGLAEFNNDIQDHIVRFLTSSLVAGGTEAQQSSSRAAVRPLAGVPRPRIAGDWWQIAGDPNLGELTTPNQQPVDFGIWQASDGTWQLWSCIRGTKEPGVTRLFYRWEGNRLTDPNWKPMGIAMHADANFGERPGGLQAPFVFRDGDRFVMFYGGWDHICSAESADGKHFDRLLNTEGKVTLFGEPSANPRDPMLIHIGNLWHCYYTAHPGSKGAVYCRTSSNLRQWGAAHIVALGGQAGDGPTAAECPFVVQLTPGDFYLFRTQRYGRNARTSVYFSRDPLDFGLDDDKDHLLGTLPVAAPELFQHEGQWFIAALLPSLQGIQASRLSWE